MADRKGSRGICLGTGTASEDDEPLEDAERVMVGGRAATLERPSEGAELTVPLEAGSAFTVTVDLNDVVLTDAGLIRFAEGSPSGLDKLRRFPHRLTHGGRSAG